MTVATITQPPFIVDLESERSTTWPDGSFVFCKDTNKIYQLLSGVFIQMSPSSRNSSSASRPLVTASNQTGFQISASRDALAIYSCTIVSSASISGAALGVLALETALTNSTTPSDWTEISRTTTGQAVSLAVVLNSISTGATPVIGFIPAGCYVRLREINTSGTPTYSFNSGQEILF